MNDLTLKTQPQSALAIEPHGNRDGKGLNGFMLDWYRTEPRGVVAKPQRQVLAEFFTSMLVLSAKFKYKPAVGVDNYLYWIDDGWNLSLIAPDQWSDERYAGFVGTCILQRDMTWTIDPSKQLAGQGATIRSGRAFLRCLCRDNGYGSDARGDFAVLRSAHALLAASARECVESVDPWLSNAG